MIQVSRPWVVFLQALFVNALVGGWRKGLFILSEDLSPQAQQARRCDKQVIFTGVYPAEGGFFAHGDVIFIQFSPFSD